MVELEALRPVGRRQGEGGIIAAEVGEGCPPGRDRFPELGEVGAGDCPGEEGRRDVGRLGLVGVGIGVRFRTAARVPLGSNGLEPDEQRQAGVRGVRDFVEDGVDAR